MKTVNGLLNKVLNKRELELETFDLIDIFSESLEEDIEEYKTKAAILEMDVSKGVVPFPTLNRAETNTWETYCPNKQDLEKYTDVVPLQVLRLATIVKEKGWFYKVQIWSENKEEIDPIMVGVLNDSWSSPKFLLARWGLSLKSYEEVRDLAKKMWQEARITKCKDTIKKAERALEDIESDTLDYFKGESSYLPF
jgi:hypothetical protein